MIVFHVCGMSKLDHYRKVGKIKGPVRAWKSMDGAVRFSCQTGRPIILRLKFPDNANKLVGHKGEAVYIGRDYDISGIIGLSRGK